MASCFKGAIHADHEGVFGESEDVTFHEGLLDLVPKDEILFIDLLHGKPLSGFFMPNKVDRPEMEYRKTEEKVRMLRGYTSPTSPMLWGFITAQTKLPQLS